MSYCDYCGTSYYEVKCKECDAGITICGCEPLKRICDECDTEWMELGDAIDALQECRKKYRVLKAMRDVDSSIHAVVQYILESLKMQEPERLFDIVTRLKQNDGESWAVGEMLHRILTHLFIPLMVDDAHG